MCSKKITVHKEIIYFISTLLLAISVSMETAADFGVSMIVAPAYIFSLKFDFLTFGQSEYVIQAIMFIAFCIIMKKIKITYFVSFLTCIIYGAVLDFFRSMIPALNPEITPPGSMEMPLRILYLVLGMILTAIAIVLACRTYISAQVYDYFAFGVSSKFKIELSKFKTVYDFSFLVTAFLMSMIFFGEIRGIGIGTLVITTFDGILIGFAQKLFDKYCITKTLFSKLEEKFGFD